MDKNNTKMSENKRKVALEIKIDEKEPDIQPSTPKAEFMALIEGYKRKNPVKYEQKKAVLEAKLASLR